ncbi:glycosyltransferase, partial [bacterium]|nr:glycosyltransferase [bacterium]
RGKGNAVRTGAEHALGAVILFTDADGSTPFAEYARLAQALEQGADIAIGSRGLGSAETKVEALWYRKIIGRVFNFLVNTFLVPGITDTQCGFKCFKRNAAEFVFTRQTAERFSFDVELLFLARKGNFIVREIPVNWHNVEGSKVNLITDSARMFIDLLLFIVKDLRGCYRK